MLLYIGMVPLFQSLLSAISRQDSSIAIVISTLIIAAIFNPLRRQIQEIIDCYFYQQKFDMEEILAQFSATAQEDVDLEPLSKEILEVVEQSLKSVKVSLWLKEL